MTLNDLECPIQLTVCAVRKAHCKLNRAFRVISVSTKSTYISKAKQSEFIIIVANNLIFF